MTINKSQGQTLKRLESALPAMFLPMGNCMLLSPVWGAERGLEFWLLGAGVKLLRLTLLECTHKILGLFIQGVRNFQHISLQN